MTKGRLSAVSTASSNASRSFASADQHAGTMSGGQQQTLAMARTLIIKPDIVMLDEPSLGLAPKVVQEMFDIMKMMSAEGVTVLLVEQNARWGSRTPIGA